LANIIEDRFEGERIEVLSRCDPGRPGAFEVMVGDRLIHSKLTRGQGRCETDGEIEAVVNRIRIYLATKPINQKRFFNEVS
jgi:hypothetical protein